MNDMTPMLKTETEVGAGEEKRAPGRPRRGWVRLLFGVSVLAPARRGPRLRRVALSAATTRRDGRHRAALEPGAQGSHRDDQAERQHHLITLPATTSAFTTANIFARASGYIDKRNVDIGDRVKAGELLAEITAPELDHQIAQAQATLKQTEATLQQNQANMDWPTSPGSATSRWWRRAG